MLARGQAQQLAGAIHFAQGDAAGAARVLASAAQAFAHDDRLARDTMFGALEAAMWCGPELTKEIARLARAFPPISGVAPSASDLLLEGYSARFTLAVHQPEHRRLPPPQGVPQAQRDVADTARRSPEVRARRR